MRTIAVMFNGKCRYTVEAPESCSYVALVRIVELHPSFNKYKEPIMSLNIISNIFYYKPILVRAAKYNNRGLRGN